MIRTVMCLQSPPLEAATGPQVPRAAGERSVLRETRQRDMPGVGMALDDTHDLSIGHVGEDPDGLGPQRLQRRLGDGNEPTLLVDRVDQLLERALGEVLGVRLQQVPITLPGPRALVAAQGLADDLIVKHVVVLGVAFLRLEPIKDRRRMRCGPPAGAQ